MEKQFEEELLEILEVQQKQGLEKLKKADIASNEYATVMGNLLSTVGLIGKCKSSIAKFNQDSKQN